MTFSRDGTKTLQLITTRHRKLKSSAFSFVLQLITAETQLNLKKPQKWTLWSRNQVSLIIDWRKTWCLRHQPVKKQSGRRSFESHCETNTCRISLRNLFQPETLLSLSSPVVSDYLPCELTAKQQFDPHPLSWPLFFSSIIHRLVPERLQVSAESHVRPLRKRPPHVQVAGN